MSHCHHHASNRPLFAYIAALGVSAVAFYLKEGLIANSLFVLACLLAGYHAIIKEGIEETIEASQERGFFAPNAHILMGLAAIGACLLSEFAEASLLCLIFAGAHFLEHAASDRSKREISKLLALNPLKARRIKSDGSTEIIAVDQVQIGDQIQVLAGDQVPCDGTIISGASQINQAAITGESLPQSKQVGDPVYASSLNGEGSFVMEVTKSKEDSVFGRILEFVQQNQANQTRIAGLIDHYEPYYVNGVILFVIAIFLLGPLLANLPLSDSLNKGLNVLVAASPCALAAATVSASLSATSFLAKRGILVKGSHYLSALAKVQAMAFDKTGTLTHGQPQVTDHYFVDEAHSQASIDLLVAMESQANHPLAQAILDYFTPQDKLELTVQTQVGQGLISDYQGHQYRIGKASSYPNVPQKIQALTHDWAQAGKTVVYFSEDEEILAAIALMDTVREEAKAALEYLRQQGIHTQLITGDAKETGQAIGQLLGIERVAANVLPEDKASQIQALQKNFGYTAMVGDGVNDAPALVQADVGIAMGQGTDIAIEVSDLVLLENQLKKIVLSHQVARKMNRVIWQNIFFSLAVVVYLVLASFMGWHAMPLTVLLHEGSTLLVILNGLRLLKAPKN